MKPWRATPRNTKGGGGPQDPSLIGFQHQIARLTEKLKELQLVRPARPNVWCTHYLVEGHIATECPRLRSVEAGPSLAAIQGGPPLGGGAAMNPQGIYQPQQTYAGFPLQPGSSTTEYCEIFRTLGHPPRMCPILQKYSMVPNNVYCEFCVSTTHNTEQCRALDALADRLDHPSYRVNDAPMGRGGGMRGGRTGGRGLEKCYNCELEGHVARECPLPR